MPARRMEGTMVGRLANAVRALEAHYDWGRRRVLTSGIRTSGQTCHIMVARALYQTRRPRHHSHFGLEPTVLDQAAYGEQGLPCPPRL